MELTFHEQRVHYLAQTRYDNLYQEQTAEMTVPETMPEIARIVDCFGTVIVGNRTVESGSVSVSGGIQAGVLYVAEGSDDELNRIDVYLPFTVTKKIPVQEDSTLFYWGWLRSIDARFINSRKVLVRANLGSELTLYAPAEWAVCQLDRRPAALACKTNVYPLRLPVSVAEKELQIADEVLMPEDCVGADRLLKWSIGAEITDTSVIGEKAVFKGDLRLRVLFRSEAGKLAAWEGTVPFSQYAELDRTGEDATVSVQPIFRHVEIDTDGQLDSRRLLLNVTLTAQLVTFAAVPVTLTEDAYELGGSFAPEWETRELTPLLDLQTKTVEAALALPQDAERILDWTVLPDAPGSGGAGGEELTAGVWANVLYYDQNNALQGRVLRDTVRTGLTRTEGGSCSCCLTSAGEAQVQGGQLRSGLRAVCRTEKPTAFRNLCGGKTEPAPRADSPSLIVRKASGPLWDVAKQCGSTVEAITAANRLDTDDLEEERLLLIPTGRAAETAKEEET